MGFGQNLGTMIVINTPNQELALTNFAYCSPSDLRKFSSPESTSTLVLVGDFIVLSVFSHSNITDGHIALNAVQRRHIKVSAGDEVSVITFLPPAGFSLALLILELDFFKGKAHRNEELNAVVLGQHIHRKFNDQTRGSTRDGTSVHDGIVNQLLTKIDGVESLNNVLLIGMTNRKDLLDEALLRPGRLEVLVEISLPDENGRLQILQIHTNTMKENSFLAEDVNLQELAERTKNFSGAELEGVVKSAVSFALNRQISLDDLTKPVDEESIKVTMNDFLNALEEIIPAFGASTDDLQRCRDRGMVDCGERHKHIYEGIMLLVKQVKESRDNSPTLSCLLGGPRGSGKTAMAATIGIDSDFPYAKIISAESMLNLSESSKCAKIVKVFEDAYRSQLSIIILDDIERLLDYVPIGPRFSNMIAQTLLVLLNKRPPKGKKMLVIGTTSEVGFLETIGICAAFSVFYHVPTLSKEDATKVLQGLNVFAREDIDEAAEALAEMPLKKLYTVVEMAAVGGKEGNSEAIYSGRQKIDINYFYDILSDYVSIRH